MPKLKDCPFCGGKADVLDTDHEYTVYGCTMCGAEMSCPYGDPSPWNKRVPSDN